MYRTPIKIKLKVFGKLSSLLVNVKVLKIVSFFNDDNDTTTLFERISCIDTIISMQKKNDFNEL